MSRLGDVFRAHTQLRYHNFLQAFPYFRFVGCLTALLESADNLIVQVAKKTQLLGIRIRNLEVKFFLNRDDQFDGV